MAEDKNIKNKNPEEPEDMFATVNSEPIQKEEKEKSDEIVNEESIIKLRKNKTALIIIIIIILGIVGWLAYSKLGILKSVNLKSQKEKVLSKEKVVVPQTVPSKKTAILDSDRDGLSDKEEKTLGTNPNKIDSDEDGLSDREEIKIYKSNPLEKDTNGDGTLDGLEIRKGINPVTGGKLLDLQKSINEQNKNL